MKPNDLHKEIYEYLHDYLNNATTCIKQKDKVIVHMDIDGWAEFDLIIDLSNAKYFDNDTMEWEDYNDKKADAMDKNCVKRIKKLREKDK